MIYKIMEHMLFVKEGAKIYSQLEELCDGKVSPEKINSLFDEKIRRTGISNAKVEMDSILLLFSMTAKVTILLNGEY